MAQEVLMPKLGLTMTEGTIEEWKYKEGDSVKKGDILFSVATDKLTNDVEAEADGVLLKILLPEGETAPCKAVIAYIGEAGEVIAEGGASAESTAAQAPASSAAAITSSRMRSYHFISASNRFQLPFFASAIEQHLRQANSFREA